MGISNVRVQAGFISTFLLGGLLAYFVGGQRPIGGALMAAGLAYSVREFYVPNRHRLASDLSVLFMVVAGVALDLTLYHRPVEVAGLLGLLVGWFIRDLVIGDEPPAPAPAKRSFGLGNLEDIQLLIPPLTQEAARAIIATAQYLCYEVKVGQEIDAQIRVHSEHINRSLNEIKRMEQQTQHRVSNIEVNQEYKDGLEQLKAILPDPQ